MQKFNIGDIIITKKTGADTLDNLKARIIKFEKVGLSVLYARALILEGGMEGKYITLNLNTQADLYVPEEAKTVEDGIYTIKTSSKYSLYDTYAYICNFKDKQFCFIYENEKRLRLLKPSEYIFVSTKKIRTIPSWIKVKVKTIEESSRLFPGNKKIREALLGRKFNIRECSYGHTCRVDGVKRDTVTITHENKIYRFLLSEIEILYPNPSGYTAPKERKIIVECKVKCSNNKYFYKSNQLKVFKNEVFTVRHIQEDEYNANNLLTLEDSCGNTHYGYQRYFKRI